MRGTPRASAGPTAQVLVERSLLYHADRVAIVDGVRTLTYKGLAERSSRLANALLSAGSSRDRPAAVWLPNRLEFIEADVACTRAGITRVAIGDRLSPDECAYILEHSQAATLITTTELLHSLSSDARTDLGQILVVDASEDTRLAPSGRVLSYERALLSASATIAPQTSHADEINYIIYTSGTTGRPKGAAHTQAGRAASMLNMIASELRNLTRESVFLHATPLSHGTGAKVFPVMAAGGTNVLLPRSDTEPFLGAIQTMRGTHTFLVPTIIYRLLDAGPRVARTVRSLQQISFGGSPIAPKRFQEAVESFGPTLVQIYGSSELPHPITVLHPEDYLQRDDGAYESAGRPALGVEVAFADGQGRRVPLRSGELLIRAPHAMCGYWRDDLATREVFTADGFYRTGDLARQDEAGLVTFHDRRRDLVITGGLNVYPSEVERVISEHSAVRHVAVVGAPDREWGEAVVAYVVSDPMREVTEKELIAWVRSRLASYKKPQRIVFVPELPVSANGKVLKRQLRDALWQERDRQVG
jgi:acyl-CoA synthetase (AMP-forming)/AMP-acid ligase II